MLRSLTTSLFSAVFFVLPSSAQENNVGVVEYAPGSTPGINSPLATIVDRAERRGEALRDILNPLGPVEGAFSGVDFDGLRRRALTDPRVQALLGADAGGQPGDVEDAVRYEGSRVFLLASFSMPKQSLRQMMVEAKKYGLPIVFRGFVNNSVYDTQLALEEVFDAAADGPGFSIDPTVFTRFRVTSVPQIIAMNEVVDVCETPGCEGDPIPLHDRVSGNVPVEFALQLIADQGDIASAEARRLLQEAGHAD